MQKLSLFLFLPFLIHPVVPTRSMISSEKSDPCHNLRSWDKTATGIPSESRALVIRAIEATEAEQLYQEMHLEGEVDPSAFLQAWMGYQRIIQKKKPILTLIDFTKPSTEKRLFVFDLAQKKLLFSSVVAHGKNSGDNYATSFSNEAGSYKSSLGFYLTGHTYQGRNGYSLLLDGLEKGFNDRARERAIVIHGATYANPSVCSSGRLGRSLGCPALPPSMTKPIINTIKDGSVLFIYANRPEYNKESTILSLSSEINETDTYWHTASH